MKVAIVGTRGIPNNYGGFETLVEYLVEYLSNDLDITVYCSSWDMKSKLKHFNGARLRYIPVSSHGAFGIFYDSLSLLDAVRRNDKVLLLGFGGGFMMPFLKAYKKKIIVNIGGLDWKRNKWSSRAQKIIKKAEGQLIKNCGEIISDNRGIQNYILAEYGRTSNLIAYGGDQALRQTITGLASKEYTFLSKPYAFVVARIQKDNNIEMMLEAFQKQEQLPLVVVGNWYSSKYGKYIKLRYAKVKNLILLDAIYDRQKLDILRSNCTLYIHGHSAGGTNPSLVEAMYLGLPIIAFASGYNEFTTEGKAIYFKNASELSDIIKNYKSIDLHLLGSKMEGLAEELYRWQTVSDRYKEVLFNSKN